MDSGTNNSLEIKNKKGRIIYRVNGVIYVIYSALIYGIYFGNRNSFQGEDEIAAGGFTILAVLIHAGVNLLFSLVPLVFKRIDGAAFFISSLLILLLGNGACYAVFALDDTLRRI
ncbi:MAG: hypothetical protein ABUK01_01050 [Leptospirales bacterium]